MDDYTPSGAGKPRGQWHAVQKVLQGNDKPSDANFALSGSEPDMDRQVYLYTRGPAVDTVVSTSQCTAAGGSVQGAAGQSGVWQNFSGGNGVTEYLQITNCEVGDVLEVTFNGGLAAETAAAEFRLSATQGYGTGGATTAAISGAISTVRTYTAMGNGADRITVGGFVTISVAGTCRIYMQGKNTNSSLPYKVGVLGGEHYSLRAIRHSPFDV